MDIFIPDYHLITYSSLDISLQWRHNDHDSVSNHQPHGCLLNRLFRRRSKKTSKLRVTGLCVGNSPGPVNSPHKGPVTRKMFPFDDVFMLLETRRAQRAETKWYKTDKKKSQFCSCKTSRDLILLIWLINAPNFIYPSIWFHSRQ